MDYFKPLIYTIRFATGIFAAFYGIYLVLGILYHGSVNPFSEAVGISGFFLISLSAFIFPSNVLAIIAFALLLSHNIVMLLLEIMFLGGVTGFAVLGIFKIIVGILMLFFSVSAFVGFRSARKLSKTFFLPALFWFVLRTVELFALAGIGVGQAIIEPLIIFGTFFWQIKGAYFFTRQP